MQKVLFEIRTPLDFDVHVTEEADNIKEGIIIWKK